MDKNDVLQRVKEIGLIAVIRGPSPELTVKAVEALVAGGVRGIEITYSTPKAGQVVRELDIEFGDQILLGMGTLTRPEQAQESKNSGARFLVSPVCEELLAKAMVDTGLAVMIGGFTPTEIYKAFCLGSDIVKLFPGSLSGPVYVKALHGPFPEIPLMPTGGVSHSNVADWFAAGVIAVGAGGELCPGAWIKEGRFPEITQRAAEFVRAVREAQQRI